MEKENGQKPFYVTSKANKTFLTSKNKNEEESNRTKETRI